MKNIILLFIFFTSYNLINAQENDSYKKIETGSSLELSYKVLNTENEEVSFACVEQMPMFPGGYNALAKFIKDTLKYPQTAKEDSIAGRVLTRFSIDKNGKVGNVYILEGVRNDLDSTCVRAINSMPNWIRPTFRNDSNDMLIYFTLPIIFCLDVNKKNTTNKKISRRENNN